MKYLLDTNILSEPLKKHPDPQVLKRLEEMQKELATAAPVWHELHYGCRRLPRSKKRNALEKYLENVVRPNIPVLAYDETAAEWHARQRALLTRKGRAPSFVDGQIAAISFVNDLVLVTRNTGDFAQFEEILLESWHSK